MRPSHTSRDQSGDDVRMVYSKKEEGDESRKETGGTLLQRRNGFNLGRSESELVDPEGMGKKG